MAVVVVTVVVMTVRVRRLADFPALELAEEREEERAAHVECSHRGGNDADDVKRRADPRGLLPDMQTALRELEQAPLSTPQIRQDLAESRDEWLRLLRGLHSLDQPSGRQSLVQASDALLALFERLTAAYEHSLQVIMS